MRAKTFVEPRNRKINAPVAGVLCQCNDAVMPDRCSVRPMARDRGCPRVLHRPIRAAGALRNGRCGKNYAVPGRAKPSAPCAQAMSGTGW